MRDRITRLQRVLELRKAEARKASEILAKSQKKLNDNLSRLRELEGYRVDYEDNPDAGQAIVPAHWMNRYHFLQRINRAVSAQRDQIQSCSDARDAHRKRWLVKNQKLESLQRMLDRYRQQDYATAERRAQKETDEQAGRQPSDSTPGEMPSMRPQR